jgi:hypothetical protein
LSEAHHRNISIGEVEAALVDAMGLDEIGDLLDRDIDSHLILRLLTGYNFVALHPEKLCEIKLSESIIPAGVPICLSEAEVKLKGERWVVHKNDADPFPSNPHAHNYEQRLKMDLRTGDLYQRKARTPCGRVRRPFLVELRERVTQKNATIMLPPLVV